MTLKVAGVSALACMMLTTALADARSYNSNSGSRSRYERDAHHRCHRLRNEFVINQSNVNTIVALACAALSHVENERRGMEYDDSMTAFHQWNSRSTTEGIKVEGACAIPYSELRNEKANLDKYGIDLLVAKTDRNQAQVKVSGKVSGRTVDFTFSGNEFIDSRCHSDSISFKKLSSISLGLGLGMSDLMDMFVRGRSGTSLHLLKNENWAQGNSNVYFSGIGLDYRMAQFNGRQLALVASEGETAASLSIRSANYLYYAEGDKFFELKKDSFDHSSGFLYRDEPINHRYQSYAIEGGAQIVGCSSLVYDGELDKPADLDMYDCRMRIDNSKLKGQRKRQLPEPKMSSDQIDEINRRTQQRNQLARIEKYLVSYAGPVKNYSAKPGLYEQGKAAWGKTERDKGYVITAREISVDTAANSVRVTEDRFNADGRFSRIQYSIKLDQVPAR